MEEVSRVNYHPNDFLNLSLAVEEEGGGLLADECVGSKFRLKVKGANNKWTWKTFHTTRCGTSARMELPYDPTCHVRIMDDEEPDLVIVDHQGEPEQYEEPASPTYTGSAKKTPKQHTAVVCAVDDAVGLWPRYAGVVSDRSVQR